jgi:hypothetical protein
MPRPARPSRAPKPPRGGCDHAEAKVVAYLARAVFDELDLSLHWCPACGALGSARYADSESIRWQSPKSPVST